MTQPRKKVSVIGLGMMGRHHVRVTKLLSDLFDVVGIYDTRKEQANEIGQTYDVTPCRSVEEAIEKAEVVYVATPTSTHHDIAMQAIQAGRHVFIEKPIADSAERGTALVNAAKEAGVLIGVGHTERFNPVVLWLSSQIADESILSINIERVGPRPPRIKDVGIVTDLGVHDLDLIAFLASSPLQQARCVGKASIGTQEDVAQIVVSTGNGVVGSINTNWLTPFKARRVTVATARSYYEGDLLRNNGKIYSYIDENPSRYAVEDANIRWQEPLQSQAKSFYKYLHGDASGGTVSGEEGLQALHWVQTCLQDLHSQS